METNQKRIAIALGAASLILIPLAAHYSDGTNPVWNWLPSPQSAPPAPVSTPDPGDVTTERFAAVRRAVEGQGRVLGSGNAAGMRCERDANAPNTIRVYFPAGTLPTQSDAISLATTMRSHLGENSIVYIKAVDGTTIAKVSPLGIE